MRNEKHPGWLGYIGDHELPRYREYFINHEIRSPILQFANHCLVGGFNPYEKH